MSIYTSILTGGSNNHQTTSEEVNYHATDFIAEGVVGAVTNTSGVAPATGAFAVNAQGTPNMTVAVSTGVGYVQATPTGGSSQTLRIYNNASSNVTISANSSGSTKYDWVYIKVDPDNAANPNSAADNVATLVTSRSSSSSSDDGTPPTYGYPIAVVTVANGASSITNGNIADKRERTGTTSAAQNITPNTIKLGYAERTSVFTTTTANLWVDVTSLSVEVTVPSGGRDIKITGYIPAIKQSGAAGNVISVSIRESTTALQNTVYNSPVSNYNVPVGSVVARVSAPSSGSHTYKVSVAQSNADTLTVEAGNGSTTTTWGAAFILVEAI